MRIPRLFRNAPGVIVLIATVLMLFFAGAATTCRAESILQLEVGSAMLRAETPYFGATIVWPKAGPGDADFECGIALVGEYEFRGTMESNQAAAQCLLVEGLGRLDIGVGVVALQNIDQLNGSNMNFSLKLGWRFSDRFTAQWRHWSNAGTKFPNYGRDFLLFSYGF